MRTLSGRGASKDMRDEPLDCVAQTLCTTVEMVRESELFGWIYIINKNGQCLLPAELCQGRIGTEDESDRSPGGRNIT